MKEAINKVIQNPYKILSAIVTKVYFLRDNLPDDVYLKIKYRGVFGEKLNLENPKTFNEKIQWLKLYDKNPKYIQMVDKYEAKNYVAEMIGKKYIIPTYGVWDSFDEIDFDILPNQFVLKCTHDSGGIIVVKNKSSFDRASSKRKINKCLKNNYFYNGREWPYKNIKPRIIAEQYLENESHEDLIDYKFYCFNGAPTYCQVIKNRNKNECMDFYDMNWNLQEFTRLRKLGNPFPHGLQTDIKPCRFENMKIAACILSKDIPFVRIDFYEVQGEMYFGEITFYPLSGFGMFEPEYWDNKLGDMILINKK